jgi:hypothetical protein
MTPSSWGRLSSLPPLHSTTDRDAGRPYSSVVWCHCDPVEKRGKQSPKFGDCFVVSLLAMIPRPAGLPPAIVGAHGCAPLTVAQDLGRTAVRPYTTEFPRILSLPT